MKSILANIIIPILLVMVSSSTTAVWATNEGSYQYGYWQGSLTGPQNTPGANWNPEFDNNTCVTYPSFRLVNGIVMPAVTNSTACTIGWFNGYKNWCVNHAINCVQNITTIGDFPPMILQAHQEYLKGYNAANGSGSSMCPIGENVAFCHGWDSNNGVDYGYQDCGNQNITVSLIGCPEDYMKQNQIGAAALPMLVGTWNYVNSSLGSTISGKIVYGANGDVNMTIPNKQFGDYKLEGSWGYIGHNILTECYAGGCENNTLTITASNHIEFTDNHGDIIHLGKYR